MKKRIGTIPTFAFSPSLEGDTLCTLRPALWVVSLESSVLGVLGVVLMFLQDNEKDW